jgi:hypothetical protein
MPIGREQSVPLNITISSGAGTGTLTKMWTLVRWLRIIPVSESDTFDVTVKDAEGLIMLSRTGQTGTLAERIEMSLGIMNSIVVANASQDGTYKCRLDLH